MRSSAASACTTGCVPRTTDNTYAVLLSQHCRALFLWVGLRHWQACHQSKSIWGDFKGWWLLP